MTDGTPLSPGLYITATPIGHAGDLTFRAHAALEACDLLLCEDTRVTSKLLSHYGIRKKLTPYHDHNAARMRPRILARLEEGASVVLVSDAGMPLISDPGYRLVREALAAGHEVTVLPGASAPLTALALSGLPSDRFLFAGFLPPKSAARRAALEEVRTVRATLLFFETGPRLAGSLADMAAVLGPRPASVARELTKLHEEVRRDRLDLLARHYAEAGPPKGEIVVAVGPPEAKEKADPAVWRAALKDALKRASVRDASAEIAAEFGVSRRDVYREALTLARRRGDS
ncbi:MAG: 16S rRNA (cytidine(1402)-2'-O)-methyltransferase [Alphaproteobacteria bacterium]